MSSLFNVGEHPGLWFVWATLLPLLSFFVLLVAAGVRTCLRQPGVIPQPPAWPAHVATGAIGLAFLCCLIGGITFFSEAAHHGHDQDSGIHPTEKMEEKAEKDDHDHKKSDDAHKTRWEGRLTWAAVSVGATGYGQRVLELGYRIDHLSVVMFLMVTFIATLIHLFSQGYMSDELQPMVEDHQVHGEDGGHYKRRGRFGRFFMYLSLFCFSMLNLILADNFFQIFLSWELVGICSFLLIGFYFERRSASTAANKAFITNRVGDAGFILGLLILWTYFGTFNFEEIFAQVRAPLKDFHGDPIQLAGQIVRGRVLPGEGNASKFEIAPADGDSVLLFPIEGHIHARDVAPTKINRTTRERTPGSVDLEPERDRHDFGSVPYWVLTIAGLGIFLGCVGKSAQFPLHVWLPDAMEGPTPVSALIHAATMVAAGVYFVGRSFPLFTQETLLVIAYTGAITLFVAATIAIVMTDIKKVLAYSTVSQLGYMMLALGIGGWVAGLFHLVTHACFKALLFLGSGSVIHGCHHEQEMTKMGGLYPKMKITAITMLIGVLAIAGIPLFSGWYSKDAIVAQALGYALVHKEHLLLFLLPMLTAGITTFYMFRMWFMTFTGDPRDHHVHDHAHESPAKMTIPLILLAILSVCVAWPFDWNLLDAENSALEHAIHHAQPIAVQAEFGMVQGEALLLGKSDNVRQLAHDYHGLAGVLATGVVLLAILFASAVYWKPYQVLDPAEAKEAFQGAHRFLERKWYFDEVYSALLVRPALVVAQWAKNFDGRFIDGAVNGLGRLGVLTARLDGLIDARIVDGLVNVIARAVKGIGERARTVQTGYLRSYILFLALATVGFCVVLAYFVSRAAATP